MSVDKPLILIVEDEPKLARLLADYLQSEGFDAEILSRGDAVLAWLELHSPALILLDVMLPGGDGMALCREIRRSRSLPIILVTARVDELDRLLGLELGADDYICKPFSPREVVARVKAVLRREALVRASLTHAVSGAGDSTTAEETPGLSIVLQPERLSVRLAGEDVTLTAVEFQLLEALVSEPGRIFSREQLMDRIYADRRVVSDRTIDSHIKKLRRKLNTVLPEQDLIHAVYGAGYKFERS